MAITYLGGGRITGLSTDTKPTAVPVGSTFLETDTNKEFLWNGTAWQQLGGGALQTDVTGSGQLSGNRPNSIPQSGADTFGATEFTAVSVQVTTTAQDSHVIVATALLNPGNDFASNIRCKVYRDGNVLQDVAASSFPTMNWSDGTNPRYMVNFLIITHGLAAGTYTYTLRFNGTQASAGTVMGCFLKVAVLKVA